MSNALLLFAQGLDEAALQRAVPPSIRPKQIEPLAWNSDEFSFDLPPAVLAGALEILPCLSVVQNGAWGYQFAIECKTKAGHSIRAVLDQIGSFARGRGGRSKRSGRSGNRPLAHPHSLASGHPTPARPRRRPYGPGLALGLGALQRRGARSDVHWPRYGPRRAVAKPDGSAARASFPRLLAD